MKGKRRETVSEVVRRAIEESGVSRYELAKRSGVSQSVLSRFVAGDRSINLETLDRLAEVLGIEIRIRGA